MQQTTMTENTYTADRIRPVLEAKKIAFEEKKMFGGWCFMVDDKMLMGTFKGGIMARVDPDQVPKLLEREGVEQMMQKERIMKGYLMLDPIAYDAEIDLEFWIDKCLEWNPMAKKSKKRRK